MFNFDQQVAIITGASAGLGFAMAEALAGAGSHVIVTSRTLCRAEAAAERIRGRFPVAALALELDQRDPESVRRFAAQAEKWQGRIEILVNNAGGGSGAAEGNLFARDPRDIAEMIGTNLTGVIYCCQEVGRGMARRKRGKIINIASIAGLVGRDRKIYRTNGVREQPVDYAAAKAGVIGLTRDRAAFLGEFQVQVNAISPGGFDKGTLPAGFISDYAALTPQGRMGRIGDDITGAVLFLASSASDHITGQNLVVDGGFSFYK